MAEGGAIHVTVHVNREGDQNIKNTNIGSLTNIARSEIGQISTSSATDAPPEVPEVLVADATGGSLGPDSFIVRQDPNVKEDPTTAAGQTTSFSKQHEDDNVEKAGPENTRSGSQQDLISQIGGMRSDAGYKDNYLAEEKAESLMKDLKHQRAVDILEGFLPSQRQQLLLIDCYFQLRKYSELTECFQKIKALMTSSPHLGAHDVYELGRAGLNRSAYIRALALFSCASKIHNMRSNPNEAVTGIRYCAFYSGKVIAEMAKQGDYVSNIASQLGIKKIAEMLVDIRDVRGANPDKKVECEAYCLNNIGNSCHVLNDDKKSIEYFELGIQKMQQHFRRDASKIKIFRLLLNNCGLSSEALGRYREAENLFRRSLDAVQHWKDDAEKKEVKKSLERNLKRVRSNIRK